jgi:hypothetical protein
MSQRAIARGCGTATVGRDKVIAARYARGADECQQGDKIVILDK